MDYNPILQQIKENYVEVIQDNLVGIYVHGSIAFNCFRWENSDIDYIVVVTHNQ
jgi:streptomycin 3"-adenylyltransferase